MTAHPPVVALTGGIGSGKSEVARLFKGWGAAVVDADELAREVVLPGTEGYNKTVAAFGAAVLNPDSTLNRAKVAEIIFNDESQRRRLEQILHPLIRSAWLSRLASLKTDSTYAMIVYTLPLFFESKLDYPEIDHVIHVSAPVEVRVARVLARDNGKEELIRARMKAQLSDEEKEQISQFVIRNDASIEDLKKRSLAVFQEISARGR